MSAAVPAVRPGGDNSDRALGIFYEGAMTTGYAPASTENAIQANIVAAGYKGLGR